MFGTWGHYHQHNIAHLPAIKVYILNLSGKYHVILYIHWLKSCETYTTS